ncbi:MAG: Vacuolar protein sorting-associated protein 41 [Alyxoria varia]|nr:MAG: Vacuolar protein sorting-associated protein 41 [Alyxoria varia]
MSTQSHDVENGSAMGETTPQSRPRHDRDDRGEDPAQAKTSEPTQNEEGDDDEEDEEDEEETEPTLKCARLTGSLSSLYKNGDSTSTFLVSGDKMIIGTHNGNVHVLSIPSLQTLRLYHAHSASITSISISPFSPAFQPSSSAPRTSEHPVGSSNASARSPQRNAPPPPRKGPTTQSSKYVVPATAANSIYIATSSIDGHVCVSSLVDPKDVILRNYARPVQAVALSPEYKTDRIYLSGGLSGSLILTTGGRPGVSSEANTNSAAAAASGWLGSMGLRQDNGRDTILHSGEGSIGVIKWSLSGKFVAWVNEQGIKIMRSHHNLETTESDAAWKRIAHIDKPNRRVWEDMASVWKARASWQDDSYLESVDTAPENVNGEDKMSETTSVPSTPKKRPVARTKRIEKLLVGWGDTVWNVHVTSETVGPARKGSVGRAEIVHKFIFDDGVVSGLSLYTPNLLVALIYRTRNDEDEVKTNSNTNTSKRGIRRRQNGLPPDLRLLDLDSSETVELEGLTVSRHETLSFPDYHLSTLYVDDVSKGKYASQRGTFGALGNGLWDVSKNATRLFSSSASFTSEASSGEGTSSIARPASFTEKPTSNETPTTMTKYFSKPGVKIFIQSPFDCVLAVKRDLSDRLTWLVEQRHYREAWELVDTHPEIVVPGFSKDVPQSPPRTPTTSIQSLKGFLEDEQSSQSSTSTETMQQAVDRQKQHIGDMWMSQLADQGDWTSAGSISRKALGNSSMLWEKWIFNFVEAAKFDEIAIEIPNSELHPPVSSNAYNVVLEHYVEHDRSMLEKLLKRWPAELFHVQRLIFITEAKLGSGDVQGDAEEGGGDWRILQESLASLYLADARPGEALKRYIELKEADPALELVRENDLFSVIAEDVYRFILVRVTRSDQKSTDLTRLADLTMEPIRLLVYAATQNLISVSFVVSTLQRRGPASKPFLYLYFRALWKGETDESHNSLNREQSPTPLMRTTTAGIPRARHRRFAVPPSLHTSTQTRPLLAPFADLSITLFAEYDRSLLTSLLKSDDPESPSPTSRTSMRDPVTGQGVPYTFAHASHICEIWGYIPELVHLLARTGQTKRALGLITEEIGDVKQAVEFVRDAEDEGLWRDLLDYAFGRKPKAEFITGLLEEIGGVIDGGMDEEYGIDKEDVLDDVDDKDELTTREPELAMSKLRSPSSRKTQRARITAIDLVNRIPPGFPIPGLKQALIRVLRDGEIQHSVAAGAATIQKGETVERMEKLRNRRTCGFAVDVVAPATPAAPATQEETSGKKPAEMEAVEEGDRGSSVKAQQASEKSTIIDKKDAVEKNKHSKLQPTLKPKHRTCEKCDESLQSPQSATEPQQRPDDHLLVLPCSGSPSSASPFESPDSQSSRIQPRTHILHLSCLLDKISMLSNTYSTSPSRNVVGKRIDALEHFVESSASASGGVGGAGTTPRPNTRLGPEKIEAMRLVARVVEGAKSWNVVGLGLGGKWCLGCLVVKGGGPGPGFRPDPVIGSQ